MNYKNQLKRLEAKAKKCEAANDFVGPLMKDIRKKLGELTGIVYDRGGLAFFEHYDAMIDEVKAKCWYHVQNVISSVVAQRSREYDEKINATRRAK